MRPSELLRDFFSQSYKSFNIDNFSSFMLFTVTSYVLQVMLQTSRRRLRFYFSDTKVVLYSSQGRKKKETFYEYYVDIVRMKMTDDPNCKRGLERGDLSTM